MGYSEKSNSIKTLTLIWIIYFIKYVDKFVMHKLQALVIYIYSTYIHKFELGLGMVKVQKSFGQMMQHYIRARITLVNWIMFFIS